MKITLQTGQNLFFTSDTHYNHSNICKATTNWKDSDDVTRDFKSLDMMNQMLVDNINGLVGQDDILIHLGDWSFGGFEKIEEFRNRIMCKNIHLVLGNHDHHISRNKENIRSIFTTVNDYLFLDLRIAQNKGEFLRYSFVCFHYPIASWNGMNDGVFHLHGHCHLPSHLRIAQGRAMDVGVDGNNLQPLEVREIIRMLDKRPIAKLTLSKDHHEKRVL